MALTYTSVARVYDLEPMVGSLSDLTSASIVAAFATPAEAEMNARLSRRYEVPVTGTVPLLQAIADDLTVYRILSRRVFTQDQLKNSVWPDKFKESMESLNEIAAGKILLVDNTGTLVGTRATVAAAATNVDTYQPTFHDGGDWLDQIKSGDKTTDEEDARSI